MTSRRRRRPESQWEVLQRLEDLRTVAIGAAAVVGEGNVAATRAVAAAVAAET